MSWNLNLGSQAFSIKSLSGKGSKANDGSTSVSKNPSGTYVLNGKSGHQFEL